MKPATRIARVLTAWRLMTAADARATERRRVYRQRLRDAHADGVTTAQLAAALGVTEGRIRQLLSKG